MYIDASNGTRMVLDTGSLLLQSAGNSHLNIAGTTEEDGLADAMRDIMTVLGVSPRAISCLKQVGRGEVPAVQFRFPENMGDLCVTGDQGRCGEPAFANVRHINFAELEKLKALLKSPDAKIAEIQVYGFATASGNAQRNLQLTVERAEAVRLKLEPVVRSELGNEHTIKVDASGRGEGSQLGDLMPNLGLHPPSALVAMCPSLAN